MLFKFIVAISILFPLIGVWLMEGGAYGDSIRQTGYPNGATWAYLIYYAGVAFFTMWAASKLRLFREAGKRGQLPLRNPAKINFRCMVLMFSMMAFLLFGLGGIGNYFGTTNSGEFRAGLTGLSGALGSIIFKYIAPAMFAFVLMTNIAWDPRRVRSAAVLVLSLTMMLIGGSYGFKSSFVLALLPAGILYCWRASPWLLLPLSFVAMCLILFGYMWFGSSSSIDVAMGRMLDRLFVLQGDVSWLMWDLYEKGQPLPSYIDTLLPVAGDRIFSFVTGITPADKHGWVMSHFGLMITYLSGYSDETILAGLNNTGTVFSEGVIAGGPFGVMMLAVLAGLIVNLLYNFIDNKLRARDFAWASVGVSYFVNAVMGWLLGGGIQVAIHISMLVLIPGTYIILNTVRGRPVRKLAPRPQTTPAIGVS